MPRRDRILEAQHRTETHPTLSHHDQREIGLELQATLCELVDLSLLGKQLHWSVVGPHFRSLHLQLDELVESWRELADTVAERAVAVGHWPDGQAATIAKANADGPVEPGAIADVEVVRILTGRLLDAVARLGPRIQRLGELDLASQDVLIELAREFEKQLWMVRVQAEE